MDEHALSSSPSPAVAVAVARGDPTTLQPADIENERPNAAATATVTAADGSPGSAGDDEHAKYDHVTDAPPFWTRHGRSLSTASYHSVLQLNGPGTISLEDHSGEQHEQSQACWAQSVAIDEGVMVSGSTGIGAYVVWHCTITTLKGGNMELRKRYSEFDRLRTDLVRSFPHAEAMIPQLPRKSVVSRFRPKFLDQRKAGLAHFLTCILLNPEFAASPVLKDFIFA